MTARTIPTFARPTTIAALASFGVLAACDPLTSPDYPGQPLFTLQGEVTSALAAGGAADGTRVAIVWVGGADNGDMYPVADSAEVSGEFPASFTLQLYHPPEEPSLLQLENGGRVGIGFIVALPEDAALGDAVELSQMLGTSNRHAVVYAPSADDAEDAKALITTAHSLQEGFNLVDAAATNDAYATCKDDAVAAIDGCFADCDANCDPDGAEDPGCDICTGACVELNAQFHACDALVDVVVSPDTAIDLVLDPDGVTESAVWSVFNPEPDNGDGQGDTQEGDGEGQ